MHLSCESIILIFLNSVLAVLCYIVFIFTLKCYLFISEFSPVHSYLIQPQNTALI